MGPILLEPTYISPIWGGTRISEARGLPHGGDVNNGEAFDVSAHEGICTTVANGPCAGMKFDEFLARYHDEVVGDLDDEATIQVVSMDPKEFLSVQVHPDEAYAQAAEGDHEKAESWYILHAEPGAELIAGCSTDDVDALRAAAADDTIGNRYGKRVEMHEGDFILIPAGTMHALGPGIFAVEIGSFGNTTYRLCDWGRGRELHVEKGFDVLKTSNEPSVRHLGLYDESAGTRVRTGVEHALFTSNVVDVVGEWSCEGTGRYQVLTCVHGNAVIETDEGTVELPYTMSAVIPACAGSYTVRGNCRVLQSYRP